MKPKSCIPWKPTSRFYCVAFEVDDFEYFKILAVGVQFVVVQWKLYIGLQLCLHDVAFWACHNCKFMYVYVFMNWFIGCTLGFRV
jgi:hypothetical protein